MRDTQRVEREHHAVLGTADAFWERGKSTSNAKRPLRYKTRRMLREV